MSEYIKRNFKNMEILHASDLNYMDDQIAENARLISELSKPSNIFNTVNDMKNNAASLTVGDIVMTLGYYSINDGGGGLYQISDNISANNLDMILLNSSNIVASLIYGDEICTLQCGLREFADANAFFTRFNGVAKKININSTVAVTQTIVLNSTTEIYSNLSASTAYTNVKWNGGSNAAVFSTIPTNGGLTVSASDTIVTKRVYVHGIRVNAGWAKAGFVFYGVAGTACKIGDLFVYGGDCGYVFGNTWSVRYGKLSEENSREYGFLAPNRGDNNGIVVFQPQLDLEMNSIVFEYIQAKGKKHGVNFYTTGTDNLFQMIECEGQYTVDNVIPVRICNTGGTINCIHVEGENKPHRYDVYLDTTGNFSNADYIYPRALMVNEMRGRGFYLNGDIMVGKIYVGNYKDSFDAGIYKQDIIFDSGYRGNDVILLSEPDFPRWTYDNYQIQYPYGAVGVKKTIENYNINTKKLNILMDACENTNFTSNTTVYNGTITVPSNSLGYCNIKKIYGNTGLSHQIIDNGNFVSLDGWVNAATYMQTMTVNDNCAVLTFKRAATDSWDTRIRQDKTAPAGHSIYIRTDIYLPSACNITLIVQCENSVQYVETQSASTLGWSESNKWVTISKLIPSISKNMTFVAVQESATEANGYSANSIIKITNFMCFDLTEIYGETIPEKDALDLQYSSYVGKYISAKTTEIESSTGAKYNIPIHCFDFLGEDSIADRVNDNRYWILRGYGESNPTDSTKANYIDFGSMTYHSFGYLCDDEWIAYAEEKIEDVSHFMPVDTSIAVEPGGSIIFNNSNGLPMKSEFAFYEKTRYIADSQDIANDLSEILNSEEGGTNES